jgi:hypothetical protein
VASQTEYAKPSRSYAVTRVEYATNGKLKPIDFRQLDSIDVNTNTTVTGIPQYYYYFDDVIGLYPAPSESSITITVHSYDEPAQPTSTSTLEIPTRYHQRLVIGVAYYMSLKELGHPNTSLLLSMWQKALADTVKEERARKSKDTPNRVLREEDLPATALGTI